MSRILSFLRKDQSLAKWAFWRLFISKSHRLFYSLCVVDVLTSSNRPNVFFDFEVFKTDRSRRHIVFLSCIAEPILKELAISKILKKLLLFWHVRFHVLMWESWRNRISKINEDPDSSTPVTKEGESFVSKVPYHPSDEYDHAWDSDYYCHNDCASCCCFRITKETLSTLQLNQE